MDTRGRSVARSTRRGCCACLRPKCASCLCRAALIVSDLSIQSTVSHACRPASRLLALQCRCRSLGTAPLVAGVDRPRLSVFRALRVLPLPTSPVGPGAFGSTRQSSAHRYRWPRLSRTSLSHSDSVEAAGKSEVPTRPVAGLCYEVSRGYKF